MTPETILAELTALAQLGKAMRKAQTAFFEKKKSQPMADTRAELLAARDLERRFDLAVKDALRRDVQKLPGMEGGIA